MAKEKQLSKEELLAFLFCNRAILNITGIGKAVGIGRRLNDIVMQRKDGHGRQFTLPEKYVQPIVDELKKLIP